MRASEPVLNQLCQSFGLEFPAAVSGSPEATVKVAGKGKAPGPSATAQREIAALAALGLDASTPQLQTAAVEKLQRDRWQSVLPSNVVVRAGWTPDIPVRLHAGSEFTGRVILEDGSVRELDAPARVSATTTLDEITFSEHALELPGDLPLGHHSLVVSAGGVEHRANLVVTPQRLELPKHLLDEQAWGITTQLYALRSDASWGIGDFADLSELGTWAATQGADFVHAGTLTADDPVSTIDPDPSRPATRIFLDPLMIRVEEILEVGYLSAAERQLVEWHGDDARRLNADVEVDRDAVAVSKRAALKMVYAAPQRHSRRRDYQDFCARGGQELRQFATWCVLTQVYGQDVLAWPASLRDPHGQDVAHFATKHADDIDFEMWLQWVAREQVARARADIAAAGMRVGVMHTLTAGEIDNGFDEWANSDRYAPNYRAGVRSSGGTSWDLGLTALRPHALAQDGFALWQHVLNAHLPLGGGLRIDRPSMLFRQWWISDEGTDGDGFWVRFDHEALIGILLLEAARAGVVVVTDHDDALEPWMHDYLVERGILTSQALVNEQEAPMQVQTFQKRSLASFGTRLSPPMAGYLSDTHAASVQAGRDDSEAHLKALRQARSHIVATLTKRELVRSRDGIEEQVAAIHRFLADAPSMLREVEVADLVGDPYLPGRTGSREYLDFRRCLVGPDERPVSLDALMGSRRVKRIMRSVQSQED